MKNFHPLFVHFPIGLLSVGVLFDILGYFLKKQSLSNAGFWCFGLGVISAVVTVLTGLQAEKTVSLSPAVDVILETHQRFQTYSTIVFVGLLIWRSFKKGALPPLTNVYLVVAALAVAAILYGSHFGGRLVYEYGVGTAVQPAVTKNENQKSENEGKDNLLAELRTRSKQIGAD